MDIKSKNTNKESNEPEIIEKKSEKSKRKNIFKGNKFECSIIYIITAIVLTTTILSLLEVKDNLGYVVPDRIYAQTQVAGNISEYTNLVEKYSLYYKSSNYTSV